MLWVGNVRGQRPLVLSVAPTGSAEQRLKNSQKVNILLDPLAHSATHLGPGARRAVSRFPLGGGEETGIHQDGSRRRHFRHRQLEVA